MSSTLTVYRVAMQELLAGELEVPFVPGMLEGPVQRTGGLGCCWVSAKAVAPEHGLEEDIELHIRVFRQFQQQHDPETPIDPAPLEDWLERVQLAIAGNEYGLGPWMQKFHSGEIDPAIQGIEVIVVARQPNVATG